MSLSLCHQVIKSEFQQMTYATDQLTTIRCTGVIRRQISEKTSTSIKPYPCRFRYNDDNDGYIFNGIIDTASHINWNKNILDVDIPPYTFLVFIYVY